MLGHRGVNTVYRYRRTSGQLLKEETKELRKTLDEILKDIVKEWDGYEQIFEMVEKNKRESKERVARAIRVIQEMSENGEQLVVCDLVK